MIRASQAAGLALALSASGLAPQAQAAGPVAADPAAVSFRLGELQLTVLRDGGFVAANDAKIFGVDAGPAAVASVLAAAGAPTDAVALNVGALLVRGDGHVVLLDTGLGPKVHGVLPESLAKAGVSPEQVTDVLITHTHFDHTGGLVTADGRPAFPKAVVRMSAKAWAFLQSQPESKALVEAIAPQVRTFEPGGTVVPGISSVAIDGHTPGHVGYEIASGRERLLDIGDTAHSSIVSLAKPEWVMGFDSDSQLARASRVATLKRLANSHELIFAPHFPFPGVGRVEAKGDGFVWKPTLGAGE